MAIRAKADARGKRRLPVNIRLQSHIREALQMASTENGVTLSSEIERRLAASIGDHQAEPSIRQIIREEIRAALDIKDARAIGIAVETGKSVRIPGPHNGGLMLCQNSASGFALRPPIPHHSV